MTATKISKLRWHHYVFIALNLLLVIMIIPGQGMRLLSDARQVTGDPAFDAINFAGALWDVFGFCLFALIFLIGFLLRRQWAFYLGLLLYGAEFGFVFMTFVEILYLQKVHYQPLNYFQDIYHEGLIAMAIGTVLFLMLILYLWWQRKTIFIHGQ